MQLLCDLRERSVAPFFPKVDNVVHKTLMLGDYAICEGDVMFFVFERKTWSDLAASIKDGRAESQMERMKSVNCAKFVIIEGKMQYHPDFMIGGIEFSKLDAYKRYLMMTGIQVVQTKNEPHTAEFLYAFMEQFSRSRPAVKGGNVKEITEKKKLTVAEQVDEIWRSFPGIGPSLVPVMRRFSIIELLSMSVESIAELKYISGRSLGASTANKILSPIYDKKQAEKVLASIYGISPAGAKYILTQVSFVDFMKGNMDVKLSDKKKLGETLKGKIYELVNYKSN